MLARATFLGDKIEMTKHLAIVFRIEKRYTRIHYDVFVFDMYWTPTLIRYL